MADGFLGRWARRKQEVREGKPLEEPAVPSPQPSPASGRGSETAASSQPPRKEDGASPPLPPAGEGRGEGVAQAVPPTLEDVRALTPQSDFQRFVAPDVDPEVKNAAMKKLFADPHFNQMDGLDIYIDDYNKPDPLPQSMLRQMASAKFLNLFDDEEKEKTAAPLAAPASAAVAQAAPETAPAVAAQQPAPTEEDHDDTDLRLQQDHAAGPQGSGRGPQ